MKTIASAALLLGLATASYNKADIFYKADLPCTSCIRGGFDFCMTYGKESAESNKIVLESNECLLFSKNPATNFTTPGTWDQPGYICSKYFKDEMAAIINMCTPQTNRSTECGPYMHDLSANGQKQVADIDIQNI